MSLGEDFYIVAALGDSLTRGYRVKDPYAIDPRVPYPAQLECFLRPRLPSRLVFVVNAGVNGDPTDGMIGRFRADVALEDPDVVIVWGGLNDLGHNRRPEQVMDNLTRLYGMCEDIGARPVACTLTPTRLTSSSILRLNDLIRAYTDESKIAIADLFPACVDVSGNLRAEYSDDGAHLTIEGYHRVAEVVFEALTMLLPNYQ
jgi:lysophospholipase L1-like esterase